MSGLSMRVRAGIFALAVVLLTPCSLFAWGGDGHVIVARVAENYLTPEARAAIKDLIGENREGERNISDARICTWADQIRSSGLLNRKYPKNDTWHYINIEIKTKQADFKPDPGGNDVLGAIERFKKVLKDPNAAKDDRKEALLFVVHFVGDMHQPLHCGNRLDDRGGNSQPIKSVLGKPADRMNLHRVWDGNLVAAERGELTVDDFTKRLISEIKEDDRATWLKGDVGQWVWESHAIVAERVYKYSDDKEFPPRDNTTVELTEENYFKINKPIVREQLKKGGVRLAATLNECFAAKSDK
jgi:S1/P1 Nuclease